MATTNEKIGETLWDQVKHDDNLFNSRASYFLVAQAMLLGGYAMLATASSLQPVPLILFGVTGCASCFVSIWTTLRHMRAREKLRSQLKNIGHPYDQTYIKDLGRLQWPGAHALMGVWMPTLLITVWLLIEFATLTHQRQGEPMQTNWQAIWFSPQLITALVATLSFIVAICAATRAWKIHIARIFWDLQKEYESEDFYHAMRTLRKWQMANPQSFSDNWKTMRDAGDEQKKVELARRRVKHFFFKAHRLFSYKYWPKELMIHIASLDGVDILLTIVEPLERSLNPNSQTLEWFNEIRKISKLQPHHVSAFKS